MKRLINNSHASDSWFLPFNGQASAEPMTSALRQKPAFSLLEKPLRSDLSPAKLTQSQAQSSHTEFCKAHSSGFSLAEAMVMLVVISILLAVSAPLIAKKSNADRNRLIVPGVSPHIATAMGANQNLGVGINNPTAKLHVTANRVLGNFVSTLTGNNAAAHNTEIFRVLPNGDTPAPAQGNNFVPNPNGFKIYADGTTNIRTCVPDWARVQSAAAGGNVVEGVVVLARFDGGNVYTMQQDGYFGATSCILNPGMGFVSCPTTTTEIITGAGNGVTSYRSFFIGTTLLPVSQNSSFIIHNEDNLDVENESVRPQRAEDNVFFVPCANTTR